MRNLFLLFLLFAGFFTAGAQPASPVKNYETDRFATTKGDLTITFLGHASLEIQCDQTVIYVDPVLSEADYTTFPKADIVLVTHEHQDHLDLKAIGQISKSQTVTIGSKSCRTLLPNGVMLLNGEEKKLGGVLIRALPAYNIVNTDKGRPYHAKGDGNGYVISFGGKQIYIGGDTENIPEMAGLKSIDIAFLPISLPYTMNTEMMANAARKFMPKILYPYHTVGVNPSLMVDLLKKSPIEVRIRKMK